MTLTADNVLAVLDDRDWTREVVQAAAVALNSLDAGEGPIAASSALRTAFMDKRMLTG
jgi:hypothetical protein